MYSKEVALHFLNACAVCTLLKLFTLYLLLLVVNSDFSWPNPYNVSFSFSFLGLKLKEIIDESCLTFCCLRLILWIFNLKCKNESFLYFKGDWFWSDLKKIAVLIAQSIFKIHNLHGILCKNTSIRFHFNFYNLSLCKINKNNFALCFQTYTIIHSVEI